jgi:hypothetical protein
MPTRRRTKPEANPNETGPNTGESGAYTVETRQRGRRAPTQTPENGPQDALAAMFESLGAGGQVGIYRTSPQWARGHLQTLTLNGGERFDLHRLDELARYWGGGTYQFRPMVRGRFAGSSRSVTLDGPTLYRGKPHPNDPEAERRRAAPAEVLPASYQGQGYPPPGYPPQAGYQYGPSYHDQGPPMQGGSPELRMLGGVVERLMSRLDSIEGRLQAPTYEPARAPDHMSGVLQTLKMAQQIRTLLDPPRDEDDEDDEDDAQAMPTDPQSLAMMLIAKKLAGDDAGDIFGGGPPRAPAPAPAPAPAGPRLIRGGGGQDSTPNPAPAVLDAQAILAAIQHLSPAERARLVNEVGQQLDPATLADRWRQLAAFIPTTR